MPSRPIIQDKAVVAFTMDYTTPLAEAGGLFTQRMTASERQDMVDRLERSIIELMEETQRTYKATCRRPGSQEIDLDYMVRLSTNEFFFYTREPLSLVEFEAIQNKIAEKAKTLSPGVQCVFGSFAVETADHQVMNVTPHITCGDPPHCHFIVKNNSSIIDFLYKIPNEQGGTDILPLLDNKNDEISLPKIKVNDVDRALTFNNVIPCQTPGGTSFLTAVEICLDHLRHVSERNIEKALTQHPCQPISQIVISNSVQLYKRYCLHPPVMHVDPGGSPRACKQGMEQAESLSRTLPFGGMFKMYNVERCPVYDYSSLSDLLDKIHQKGVDDKGVDDKLEDYFNQKKSELERLKQANPFRPADMDQLYQEIQDTFERIFSSTEKAQDPEAMTFKTLKDKVTSLKQGSTPNTVENKENEPPPGLGD